MKPLNQRGLFLETILSITHKNYRSKQLALIYKVPVLKMLNPQTLIQRNHYFCDYVGCYEGYYFEFEAKETNRKAFHWDQLRKNQQYKLKQINHHKGLGFVIIYFDYYQQFWLLFYDDLLTFVTKNSQTISHQNCQKLGFQLILKNNSIIDYLPILTKKIVSKRDNSLLN